MSAGRNDFLVFLNIYSIPFFVTRVKLCASRFHHPDELLKLIHCVGSSAPSPSTSQPLLSIVLNGCFFVSLFYKEKVFSSSACLLLTIVVLGVPCFLPQIHPLIDCKLSSYYHLIPHPFCSLFLSYLLLLLHLSIFLNPLPFQIDVFNVSTCCILVAINKLGIT